MRFRFWLNWNGWRDTIECLESLQRITYPDYRVVVVDNGSTDGSIDRIEAWATGDLTVESRFFTYDPVSKPVHRIVYDRATAEMGGQADEETSIAGLPSNATLVLIHNEENLGFSAGANVAIRYAMKRDFSLILLLKSDTVVSPDFLTSLVDGLEIHPNWIAVGPKILYKDDPGRIWYCGGHLKLWRLGAVHIGINQPDNNSWSGYHHTDHIPGCCLLARKDLFEALGLLDEDFFFGHEDAAHACMARKRGLALGVNLDAIIYHAGRGDSEAASQTHVYYYNKYRLLILRKHGALADKIVGALFFASTRLVKWPQLVVQGRSAQVRAEMEAVLDFLAARYGDHDRKEANSHV